MNINKALYVLSMFSDISSGSDTYHQRRAAFIAYRLAQELGFNENGLNLALQAAFIHDMGILSDASKIETFRQILDENFEELTKHAVVSSRLARYFNLHLDVSNAISLHHTPNEINPAVLGNILFLADNIEVAYRSLSNPFAFSELYDFVAQKSEIFDKDALAAFKRLSECEEFWYSLNSDNLDRELLKIVGKHEYSIEQSDFIKRFAYFTAYATDNISMFFDGYSVLMKNIAVALGYKLSLDVSMLSLASLFAHMGNVLIPEDLINSPAKLEDDEINIIKSHTYYTTMFLDMLEVDDKVKNMAVHHHEYGQKDRYPFCIKSVDRYEEVMSVSSVLAALLQDRPYRVAYSNDEAKDILKDMEFDKDILNTALDLDLDKIKKAEDEYYEGIRRLFV